GQVGNEYFGNGFPVVADHMTLKSQGVTLNAAIGAKITVRADPAFLEGFFDLIRAGLGISNRACGKDAKILGIVIARVVLSNMNWANRNAHADIAQVDIVGWGRVGELCHYMVFVGKANPLTGRVPHMNVRASAQCAGGEWRGDVAGIKVNRGTGWIC